MSLWEDRKKEDEEIADMISGVLPEEREQALKDFYGRDKSGFEWLDFGEDKQKSDVTSSGGFDGYKLTEKDMDNILFGIVYLSICVLLMLLPIIIIMAH